MDGFLAFVIVITMAVFAMSMAFEDAEEDACAKKHDVYKCEWVLVPVMKETK
jgi:hypothetical protein